MRYAEDREAEHGFTLVELLVTILIVGLLAALAIPSFLEAQGQAGDAAAKSLATEASTDAETLGLDNAGSFVTVKKAALHGHDPALVTTSTGAEAYLSAASGTVDSYTLTVISAQTGNKFTLQRRTDGTVVRSCKIPARSRPHGGCERVSGVTGRW